jgi:NAD-dependent deacetylase
MGLAVETVIGGETPPRCDCGGLLKPDVVLFGEGLPDATFERARSLASRSDVFLAAGSSLTVEPAASLPRLAARDGRLVVVNLEATPLDDVATHVLRSDVTETLPAICDAVDARLPGVAAPAEDDRPGREGPAG